MHSAFIGKRPAGVTSYVGAGRRFIRSLIGMGDVDGIVVKGCGLGGVPAAMFVLVALRLSGGISLALLMAAILPG
jgi:L-asparaginase/Glu-tRNA(Gln) amidotransferase subunit D